MFDGSQFLSLLGIDLSYLITFHLFCIFSDYLTMASYHERDGVSFLENMQIEFMKCRQILSQLERAGNFRDEDFQEELYDSGRLFTLKSGYNNQTAVIFIFLAVEALGGCISLLHESIHILVFGDKEEGLLKGPGSWERTAFDKVKMETLCEGQRIRAALEVAMVRGHQDVLD